VITPGEPQPQPFTVDWIEFGSTELAEEILPRVHAAVLAWRSMRAGPADEPDGDPTDLHEALARLAAVWP
jgi:hypothetical protein